jgi:hypothetical protein
MQQIKYQYIYIYSHFSTLTITIYVNTGRIQAQGRLLQEWGVNEFNNVIAMVNSPDTSWNNESIKPFLQTISKPKNDKTQINSQSTDTADQTMDNTSAPTSPREKSFTSLKTQQAYLEAKFVLFKENTTKTICELIQSLEKKESETNTLKNAISILNSSEITKQQFP